MRVFSITNVVCQGLRDFARGIVPVRELSFDYIQTPKYDSYVIDSCKQTRV